MGVGGGFYLGMHHVCRVHLVVPLGGQQDARGSQVCIFSHMGPGRLPAVVLCGGGGAGGAGPAGRPRVPAGLAGAVPAGGAGRAGAGVGRSGHRGVGGVHAAGHPGVRQRVRQPGVCPHGHQPQRAAGAAGGVPYIRYTRERDVRRGRGHGGRDPGHLWAAAGTPLVDCSSSVVFRSIRDIVCVP